MICKYKQGPNSLAREGPKLLIITSRWSDSNNNNTQRSSVVKKWI